jgi:hypothetical protein
MALAKLRGSLNVTANVSLRVLSRADRPTVMPQG